MSPLALSHGTAGEGGTAGGGGTAGRAFTALLARDLRVIRRSLGMFVVQAVMQPFSFAFIFAYVIPATSGAARTATGPNYATTLAPGLLAVCVTIQAVTATITPLIAEFGPGREIEDRLLAPLRTTMLGLQKITSSTVQAMLAGLIVLPVTLLVHAPGQAPELTFDNWALFLLVLTGAALFGSSLGLLLGTLIEIQQANLLFATVRVPLAMLGCAYFSWESLDGTPWLQVLTLIDPVTYMSEALRAVLTPDVAHLPLAVSLPVLLTGTAVLGLSGLLRFRRRAVL
ncbi:ABC transporter permease [Streptomyces narbonensis]|uniref:ABC transporter permease n=1 Tax=Streptomyces narbonensis TaxID=67333 RepID=UPI0033F36141